MNFSYATPTSGPSAGGIGWFDFGNLVMNPGDTVSGLNGVLDNGDTVTFDLTLSLISGTPRAFEATSVPTFPGTQFGASGYTGITGNVAMYAELVFPSTGIFAFTISNIVVKTTGGDTITNYSLIVADAERTNLFEQLNGQTNGSPWTLLASLGAVNPPTLLGVGTQNFSIVGNEQLGPQQAYVLETQSPSQVVITLHDLDPVVTRQAFSLGFATTRIKLEKFIAGRLDSADQFQLNITGIPSDTVATQGTSTGTQTEFAQIYAIPGNSYSINEAMGIGSVSLLSDYNTIVSASNSTPAGTVPPLGALPINFTPALGDDVTYTVYNAVPYTFTKTVDKVFADIGDVLTYTVVIANDNDFAVTNVSLVDPTPTGVSYIGNLLVNRTYSGTNPMSGIVINSIPAKENAVVSWQVQVNTAPPIATPVINLAEITIPDGNSGMTNFVTTDIRTAYVSALKEVDKVYSQVGDILTYTLTLSNDGNVAAYNVVITDALPAGVTYVAGSLVGATGAFPTLTLNTPIASGGTAIVTYQVKVNSLPYVNPIPNSASAKYSYTVDPANPLGKTKFINSNTVETLVSEAKLSIKKSANKFISYIGDIISYQIVVKNIGNVPADNVVITDILTAGTQYIPGSLVVSVPSNGDPNTAISLNNPIAPGQTVIITFNVKVLTIPNPNPILNTAKATFAYTVNPQNPDDELGSATSNTVHIIVYRNNYMQQVNDLIESVAQEQTALAAIANAEGSKIQMASARTDVTPEQVACLNKTVSALIDSITILEGVIEQKLKIINCQLDGEIC